jgi:hypothetical protein
MRQSKRILIALRTFKDKDVLRHFLGIKKQNLIQKIFGSEKDYIKEILNNLERISIYWQANPDLRFGQLLYNLNLVPNDFKYNAEECDWLIDQGYVNSEDILFWGRNFNKDGERLKTTEWILLKELTTDHIVAILKHEKKNSYHISTNHKKYFLKRINDEQSRNI